MTPQWRAAYASTHRTFRRLVLRGLIKKSGEWGPWYELTEEGYEVAATFADEYDQTSAVKLAVNDMREQIKEAEERRLRTEEMWAEREAQQKGI